MFVQTAAVLGLASLAVAASSTTSISNTATDTAAVASELATNLPLSPTSNVKGKVFDRIVVLMMENTDLTAAMENPNMALLTEKGITLTNYFGDTHPSEPNYAAIHGGDHFGMDNDNFNSIPANVSTLFDLLAEKGISFGEYQEDLPYPGFEGFAYLDPITGANNYVRKHNPAVLFDKNVQDPARLNTIKSLSAFYDDMDANVMPQYIYITPNMLNDAHDTGIVYGADWLYQFLEPILSNTNFMNNTLLVINFDECETYTIGNRVMTILISDTMPASLINTTDDTFYTHYSILSTIEANWDLSHLGRWDTHANVLKYVADTTGDVIRAPDVSLDTVFFNQSYPGAFAKTYWGPMPAPNVSAVVNGRSVFSEVLTQWGDLQDCTYYTDQVVPPDGLRLPKVLPVSCYSANPKPLSTSTSVSSTLTSVSAVTTPTGTATSGISSEPSASSYTTSTVYTTSTYTVTSCAATITDCPAKIGSVTTETIALYTTVCPVTASETSNSVSIKPTSYSTSTIYTNFISTITSCATTVTDCPAASIKLTTIKIAISTTLCPITEPQSTHLPAVASSAGVVGIVSASKASSISTEYTTLPVSSTTSIALSGNTGSSRNSTVTAASATPTSASFTGAGAAGFGVPSSLWLTCISILALLN